MAIRILIYNNSRIGYAIDTIFYGYSYVKLRKLVGWVVPRSLLVYKGLLALLFARLSQALRGCSTG